MAEIGGSEKQYFSSLRATRARGSLVGRRSSLHLQFLVALALLPGVGTARTALVEAAVLRVRPRAVPVGGLAPAPFPQGILKRLHADTLGSSTVDDSLGYLGHIACGWHTSLTPGSLPLACKVLAGSVVPVPCMRQVRPASVGMADAA